LGYAAGSPGLIAAFAGFTTDIHLGLYLIFSSLLCLLYVIQIVPAIIIFKISGIHPLGGEEATGKIAAVLIMLITPFLFPFVSLFPLFGLWLSIVIKNPK
jgi:hypothetical protein